MNGVYEDLIVSFGILKFFVLFKIHKYTVFEAVVHAEVDGPGKLQKYGALNMKKKIDQEGLGKGTTDVKNE